MSNGRTVARIVADTDALLFWGNSGHLDKILTNIEITTTNACVGEVTRHANQSGGHYGLAGLGPDERRRVEGATNILPFLEEDEANLGDISTDEITINSKFCGLQGLHHEPDGGEQSIAELLSNYTNSVEVVAMMDSGSDQYYQRGGRELVKNEISDWSNQNISFISPAPVLALLVVEDVITESEACSDLAHLIEQEGWPDAAWHDVPLNCSEGPSFLPMRSGPL